MADSPLSFTKRGKLIAVAGGVLGGPIGMLLSPLVLMLVNLATCTKGKAFNRFAIWAALGIIGIPASVISTAVLLFGTAVILDPSVLQDIPSPGDTPTEGEINSFEESGAPREWISCLREKYDYNKCHSDENLSKYGYHTN